MQGVNVLFIYPDFLEATKSARNIPGSYNEGLASLSAVLKQGGHNVQLYHMTFMPDREEFLEKVKSFAPGIIGISIRTSALGFSQQLAVWLDEEMPDIFVMTGMYHPSLAPEEVIALRGVDAVCIGEGEAACLELVDHFAQHGKLATDVGSFWVKGENGEIHKNPVRPYILNLDELPFPDLDLFDYRNLRSNAQQNTAEVIVSRGCIYSCTYCANAQLRNIYPDKKNYARFRSPENAIMLLERVLEKDPGIECFSFNDAILNVFEDWFYDFAALYKERINKKYVCNLRFDLLDEKMIGVLADTGCYLVTIGLENGNEEFRKKYLQRSMENEHIIKVSQMLKSAGIIVNAYNILGLPHETLPLSLETVKLNARMHTDNVILSFFYPYPTTKLRDIAEEAGFIDPDVDPHDLIQLRMPGYTRGDLMYIRYSFMKLMKKYRNLYAGFAGEELERRESKLDGKILAPGHPRRFIGAYRRLTHRAVVFAKRIASRYLPAIYKALRRSRDKRAGAAGANR